MPTVPATNAKPPTAPGIRLDGVRVTLGEREVLREIDLSLTERRVAVIGANGSGKSTLLRLLNGLVLPTEGRVTVDGLDTRRAGPQVRRKVGFIFTDPDAQIVMPTVAEDVGFSLRSRGLTRQQQAAAVRQVLTDYGLADHWDHPAHLLSGGQKQLLALCSVMAAKPEVLVADEPTTLLDLRNTRIIADLLAELPQRVVLCTHDLELVRRYERVVVIDGGRIVADGDPATAVDYYRRLLD